MTVALPDDCAVVPEDPVVLAVEPPDDVFPDDALLASVVFESSDESVDVCLDVSVDDFAVDWSEVCELLAVLAACDVVEDAVSCVVSCMFLIVLRKLRPHYHYLCCYYYYLAA